MCIITKRLLYWDAVNNNGGTLTTTRMNYSCAVIVSPPKVEKKCILTHLKTLMSFALIATLAVTQTEFPCDNA